ncbi:protein FAM166B-like [Sphaerodactylus townsendi]|uniref:protein FAM166B-like n=1 Tax=Sphaerodactylus townsendi TaxID=933632 RepID=UPI0020267356|nr:protein FAM166B-like [Sphaerodactylus townsendi]
MFSDHSSYIPGYTGFIPKLQSVVGETYGNATRKLLSHQATLLRLSHSEFSLPGHKYHPSRSEQISQIKQPDKCHYPQLTQEDGNATYEYLPTSTKRPGFAQNLIYDGTPQTTSAIQSMEKVKADVKPPSKPSTANQLGLTKLAESVSSTAPGLPLDKDLSRTVNISISTAEKARNTEGIPFLAPKKREKLRKQQGKLIYRTDCNLLPNYTGYIPGHKFSFGKTWGASTRGILRAGKWRSVIWTSPM